ENSQAHIGVRHCRGKQGIANIPPLLLREKEEGVLNSRKQAAVTLAKIRKVNWPTNRSAKVVVAQRCALGIAVRFASKGQRQGRSGIRYEVVRIQSFVSHEFKQR